MFVDVCAATDVLRKWKQNPSASKREIGCWSHWMEPKAENNLPLSKAEVARMKRFLKKHAPSNYRAIFGK
jgi:hypothetical protein